MNNHSIVMVKMSGEVENVFLFSNNFKEFFFFLFFTHSHVSVSFESQVPFYSLFMLTTQGTVPYLVHHFIFIQWSNTDKRDTETSLNFHKE